MRKTEVLNPILLYNTPGQELAEILISNNVSTEQFLHSTQFNSSVFNSAKFTIKELNLISSTLKNPDLKCYFLNFQTKYKDNKNKIEVSYKESLKIYRKVSHILPLLNNEFNDGIDVLEDIADFLNIDNEKEIFQRVSKNIALYKISDFDPDDLNLYAWLRRGEIDFSKLHLPIYNKELFLNWINELGWKQCLSNVNYFKSIPEILKEFGVGVVYTPYLTKTVYGAVRWFDGRPLIQVSDHKKCLASAWYTLFHEIGHVILHENADIFDGNDITITKANINKKEKEANGFASDYLFNGDGLRKYVFSMSGKYVDESFIRNVSNNFKASEIFVAFWMKKANVKSYNRESYLPQIIF